MESEKEIKEEERESEESEEELGMEECLSNLNSIILCKSAPTQPPSARPP